MQFTGDMGDVCPISFVPVVDIEHPVGFDSRHAFECECIVEWLTVHKSTNPMTGQSVGPVSISSVLTPLIIGDRDNTAETSGMLRGTAIGNANNWRHKVRNDIGLVLLFFVGFSNSLTTIPGILAVVWSFRADYPTSALLAIAQVICISCCHGMFDLIAFHFLLLAQKFMMDFATVVLGYEIY